MGTKGPIHRASYGRALMALSFGLLLGWSASVYGATETQNGFRLALMLSVPLLIGVGLLAQEPCSVRRLLPAAAIGLFLLLRVTIGNSLEGPGLAILASGWMAFFLTLLLASNRPAATKWLVFMLITLGVTEAVVGLIQSVGGVDYIGDYYRQLGRRASGTLINPNHFAALLNITLGLAFGALYAGFHRRGRLKRRTRSEEYAWAWSILVCSAFVGLAVLASLSRSGVVTLVLTMTFITLLWGARENRKHLKLGPLLLLLLVLSMGTWIGLEGH